MPYPSWLAVSLAMSLVFAACQQQVADHKANQSDSVIGKQDTSLHSAQNGNDSNGVKSNTFPFSIRDTPARFIPQFNPLTCRIREVKNVNLLSLLLRQFPGFYYQREFHMRGDDWVVAWRSTNKIERIFGKNECEYGSGNQVFETESYYFTWVLRMDSFVLNGVSHKLVVFNTSNDENNVGRLIGGLVSLLVLKQTDSSWVPECYNAMVGYFGSWQTASMPQVYNTTKDYVILEFGKTICYAGGPCVSELYVKEYQAGKIKSMGMLSHVGFFKQMPGSAWSSETRFNDTTNEFTCTTEGNFCPECGDDFPCADFASLPPVWVHENLEKQPFRFRWVRSLVNENGVWVQKDRGCTSLYRLSKSYCCGNFR